MSKNVVAACIFGMAVIGAGSYCVCNLLLSKTRSIDTATQNAAKIFDNGEKHKPIDGYKLVDFGGSITSYRDATIRITNPTEQNVYVCVRSTIQYRQSTDKFTSPMYCVDNLAPHTSTITTIVYNDLHDKISELCFDDELYNRELVVYSQALATWQTTVNDYTVKAETNQIYVKALEVLRGRKPQEPKKIFSWKSCEFNIVDGLAKK